MERVIHFLLVEDDEVDAEAVLRAFQHHQLPYPVRVVPDGLAALDVLRGAGSQPPLPWPYLIMLDLDLPRMNGLEFLQVLRQDPTLRRSIVFVLTVSDSELHKQAFYHHHIAGYFLKQRVNEEGPAWLTWLALYCRLLEFPQP